MFQMNNTDFRSRKLEITDRIRSRVGVRRPIDQFEYLFQPYDRQKIKRMRETSLRGLKEVF